MYSFIVLLLLVGVAYSKLPEKQVTDNAITAGQKVTWSKDTIYIMKGLVFVDSGAVLTIEPGTIVKAYQESDATEATALVVCRDAKIIANGTATHPIIFTYWADDPTNPNEEFDVENKFNKEMWGGVIILGKATVNSVGGVDNIEGINELVEPRGIYGGGSKPDDDDSSGVFRYVSIRFGGYILGATKEINGLTMGGVGRRTVIEYVEVFNNGDDGFEWFGGSVNCRYLVSAFVGDDAFDYDQGWIGRGQYWFCIHHSMEQWQGDRAGEHTGGPLNNMRYSYPVIANVTYIGYRRTFGIFMDLMACGKYFNMIMDNFESGIRILTGPTGAFSQFEAGNIAFKNSIFWRTGSCWQDEFFCSGQYIVQSKQIQDSMRVWKNIIKDPKYVSYTDIHSNLDLRPTENSPAILNECSDEAVKADGTGFIVAEPFIGAFDPWKPDWMKGWTALDHYGFLGKENSKPVINRKKPCNQDTVTTPYTLNKITEKINVVSQNGNIQITFPKRISTSVFAELITLNGTIAAKTNSQFSGEIINIPTNRSIPTGQYVVRLKCGPVTVSKPVFVLSSKCFE